MMSMGSSASTDSMFANGMTPDDYCYVGDHNGTWPNGTIVAGTWKFGVYVPTSAIKSACQVGNEAWAKSVRYGYWVVYVFLAFFFVCAVVNHFNNYQVLNRSLTLPTFTLFPRRAKAAFRALDTPRLHHAIPPLGSILVGLGLLAYGLAICFGIRPFYRPPNFGSSPLGLRAEWLATAPIVFVFATAVKRNALGWLTGIPFARLMDLHKISGWFIFLMAIIHTVAMMVRALRQAPWSYTLHTSPISYGWAAWGALITLGWLCVMSLGPARRLSHEWFYVLHMVNVLLFIVFMYYHCFLELNSWSYLHAAVVVLGLAVVHRFGVVAWNTRGFTRVWRAWVEPTGDGALLVRIPARGFTWSAGDHVYVRFLTVYAWQTHPFTIMNLPDPDPSQSELHILLRPRAGLTAKLVKHAAARPLLSFPVHLDGPYAATANVVPTLAAADDILLLAGGTGMSYVLPLLTALAVRGGVSLREHRVTLVWVVPRKECIAWYRNEIDAALAAVAVDKTASHSVINLAVEIYVTSEPAGAVDVPGLQAGEVGEKGRLAGSATGTVSRLQVVGGRPDVRAVVYDITAGAQGTVVVVGCGPSGLLCDARNEVAKAQMRIARGDDEGAGEVVYIEELFE